MVRVAVALLAGFFVVAGPASAGGPKMVIGAAEDSVRQSSIVAAKAQFDLLSMAGLRAVRITSHWEPGMTEPDAAEQETLQAVAGAASMTGMRVYVSVFNSDYRTTPLTDDARQQFASYTAAIVRKNPTIRDVIIGNEPNLNRFWMPQFRADGTNAAASDYLTLLAQTYDALKQVSPSVRVIGGAISPRGNDKPNGIRPTHSPTTFIQDMGTAYRQSGRTEPVMDAIAIHPYADNSSTPPSATHPNTTSIGVADYGKLVDLLGKAFDGTRQRGSTLPIVYGEFGVETIIPPDKAGLYSGTEPASVKPVDEATQAAYYREALGLAFCQPTVSAFLFFHAVDERGLPQWQSGMFYADDSPKSSLGAIDAATRDTRGGIVTRCPGMALSPRAKVSYPGGASLRRIPLTLRLTCDIDCSYQVRLQRLPKGTTKLATRGIAQGGQRTKVILPSQRVAPGRYRFAITLLAPVNTGPARALRSGPFTLR
jgi:hypothetical protein